MKNSYLSQGTALVIGGSGGMGAVIAKTLAANGSAVAITYRSNRTRAEQVAEEIRATGVAVSLHALDISDEAAVQRVCEELKGKRLHTVVQASGSDIKQPLIRDLTPADWRSVVDADINGFFNVLHYTLPLLKSGGGGSYVHLSSCGLFRWPHGDVLSVSPKACIDSLLQGIAREEGKHGVRANSIAVGVIETGIFLRLRAEGVFDEHWCNAAIKNQSIKRFGKPQEIADAALFLATAEFVTGQTICVDGGFTV